MRFRISFAISKDSRKLSLRFWKWDIWRLDSSEDSDIECEIDEDKKSKGGFFSFKNQKEEIKIPTEKLILQALFYPNVEKRLWKVIKRLTRRSLHLFSISFPELEVKGSLGDPYYNSILTGIAGKHFVTDWDNYWETDGFSVKGEVLLKTGFFHFLLFVSGLVYELIAIAFVLWRGTRLAKKNPEGADLSGLRKWIFLKASETL